VDGDDWETTTTISCATGIVNRAVATADANPTSTPEPILQKRAGRRCVTDDIIIYPKDFKILPQLRGLLERRDPDHRSRTWLSDSNVVEVGGHNGFVAFILIPAVRRTTWMDWQSRQNTLVSIEALEMQ
jgi:hypothetical protein